MVLLLQGEFVDLFSGITFYVSYALVLVNFILSCIADQSEVVQTTRNGRVSQSKSNNLDDKRFTILVKISIIQSQNNKKGSNCWDLFKSTPDFKMKRLVSFIWPTIPKKNEICHPSY